MCAQKAVGGVYFFLRREIGFLLRTHEIGACENPCDDFGYMGYT